jgi:hypothetical protein
VSLGGVFSLEQPSGSLLEFYPTWRFVLTMLFQNGGPRAAISLAFSVRWLLQNRFGRLHILKVKIDSKKDISPAYPLHMHAFLL